MSYQTFYDIKKALEEQEIITSTKEHYVDHEIKILENEFTCEEDLKEGYINTNHQMFWDAKFFKLKAGAKLLSLEFLMLCQGHGQHKIGVKNFYKKYTKILGVTHRVLRNYLMALKEFFSIGIVDGNYYIRPMAKVFKQPGQATEHDNLVNHNVDMLCRRNRIKESTQKERKDLVTLIKQYKKKALEHKKNIISVIHTAIEKSLLLINVGNKSKKKRELKPKLIHKLIKEELTA